MRYEDFRKQVVRLPVILSKDLLFFDKNRQPIRNQLNRWVKKRLVLKMRRGIYLLNENDRRINPSRQFVANQLYAPSYVSLEYALNLYGLIPERVTDVTSVTTKKTARFKNALGLFTFQHVKPAAFAGFRAAKDEAGLSYFIALPEKAVADFLYFKSGAIKPLDRDALAGSYRFQNMESLSRTKLMKMAEVFKNDKVMNAAKIFCELIERGGKS